jgi:hypothetical protein
MIRIGNQRMTIDFNPVYALFWIEFKAFCEKILTLFTYICSIERIFTISGFFKLSHWAAGKYWKSPEEHLEEDHADRPNISPEVVGKALHDLRRHGEVAA